MLARLTSGSVDLSFLEYPRVSKNFTLPAAPNGARWGPFLRRGMQRPTSFFLRLSAHSAGAYTFYTLDTVAHNASARAPPTPGTPGRVWKSIASYGPAASYSLSAMCRVPEFWASTSSVRSRGIRGTVEALTVSIPWAPCPTERRVGAYTYYTLDTWLTGSVSVPTPSTPWTPWPTGQRVGLYTSYTLDTAGPVWLGLTLRWHVRLQVSG